MKETASGECLCARCERHRRRASAFRRIDTATQAAAMRVLVALFFGVIAVGFVAMTYLLVVLVLDRYPVAGHPGQFAMPSAWHLVKDGLITLLAWSVAIQAFRGLGDL